MVGAPRGAGIRPSTAGCAPFTSRISVCKPAASRRSRVNSPERRTFAGSNCEKLTEGMRTKRSSAPRISGMSSATCCRMRVVVAGSLVMAEAYTGRRTDRDSGVGPGDGHDLRDGNVAEPGCLKHLLEQGVGPLAG